jgi:hypothetical protein
MTVSAARRPAISQRPAAGTELMNSTAQVNFLRWRVADELGQLKNQIWSRTRFATEA